MLVKIYKPSPCYFIIFTFFTYYIIFYYIIMKIFIPIAVYKYFC